MPTNSAEATTLKRQTRRIIAGTAAGLAGKERGPDRQVRRDSYDENDRRAKPWRPIGDGTTAGALDWIDALIKTAEEYDRHHKQPGGRGGLGGPYVIQVLRALLGRRGTIAVDFKTGRLDPSYDTLMKVTGYTRATIARALGLLRKHGFLDWVRRSRRTGNERGEGPQREQASNAYFFSFAEMARGARQRFRHLLRLRARARAERASVPPDDPRQPPTPSNPHLAAALQRLSGLVQGASPDNGLYPA